MTAALNIAKKCTAMGGTWLRFNNMSQRTEILDLEVGFSEEFEQSWTLYTQWKKETTESAECQEPEQKASVDLTTDTPQKARLAAKASIKNKETGEVDIGKKPKRAKTSLGAAMAVSQTVKKELGLAQFTAAGLKKRTAAENWTWAAEERDAWNEALDELNLVAERYPCLVTEDLCETKRGTKEHELEVMLDHFNREMEEPLKQVSVRVRMLLGMCDGRRRILNSW